MNSVHDMGGMHGLGRVEREEEEPVFHSAWEKNVFAMNYAVTRTGLIKTDEMRYARERMSPLHYLAARYYERTLHALEQNLLAKGIITEEELAARAEEFKKTQALPARTGNRELVDLAGQLIQRGRGIRRFELEAAPRFEPGDPVATRNIHPKGHTRLPRYARGKHGVIVRVHGAYAFADTVASGLGENPQYVYSVRFDGLELWGSDAEPNTVVYLDLWESYLEPTQRR
ncbi:MAG: nitrile hydratase subunit beta [Deltaproteobacteria bacterium]|nr:nitrile hydratase subunit beta [Deltaproteobacteria bacterium]